MATIERSRERLHAHYVAERALAERLRKAASFEERRQIFSGLYEELFAQVPDHPRLLNREGAKADRERDVRWNLAQLKPFIRPGCVFLEVGAGDCALARRVAETAEHVYAVDISDQTLGEPLPVNCELVLSNGRSVDVPPGTVDVAFSDQLMEHLHPEDAMQQLRGIRDTLKPGGAYVCITPNRVYGPTDVSGEFDDVATGFHLHEYSLREIRTLFRDAGFGTIEVYVGARGWYTRFPSAPLLALEWALDHLPSRIRRRIARKKPVRALLGLRVAAWTPR